MTLEEEIFKKSELDNNKLLEYGFIKKDNYLEYKKPILNNNFEIIVKVKENKIKGKIIDKELEDESLKSSLYIKKRPHKRSPHHCLYISSHGA